MQTIAQCNGVTEEFTWYEVAQISAQLKTALGRMERLEATLKARNAEKDEIISYLHQRTIELQGKLDALNPTPKKRAAAKKRVIAKTAAKPAKRSK